MRRCSSDAVFATVIAYAPFSDPVRRPEPETGASPRRRRARPRLPPVHRLPIPLCVHHVRNHLQPHVGAALTSDASRLVPRISSGKTHSIGDDCDGPIVRAGTHRTRTTGPLSACPGTLAIRSRSEPLGLGTSGTLGTWHLVLRRDRPHKRSAEREAPDSRSCRDDRRSA